VRAKQREEFLAAGRIKIAAIIVKRFPTWFSVTFSKQS
jgi:hypothetical protein